jgi:hypothetical protein
VDVREERQCCLGGEEESGDRIGVLASRWSDPRRSFMRGVWFAASSAVWVGPEPVVDKPRRVDERLIETLLR